MPPITLQTQIRLQTQAISRINNGVMSATREIFEGPILSAAREMSPVGEGSTGVHNRDSISVKVRRDKGKIRAAIFTQSGHGGYLERGTRKMSSRPYIYPAFMRSLPMLNALIASRVDSFSKMDMLIADGGYEGLAENLQSGEFKGAPDVTPSFDERGGSHWETIRARGMTRNKLWKQYVRDKNPHKGSWADYMRQYGVK